MECVRVLEFGFVVVVFGGWVVSFIVFVLFSRFIVVVSFFSRGLGGDVDIL